MKIVWGIVRVLVTIIYLLLKVIELVSGALVRGAQRLLNIIPR